MNDMTPPDDCRGQVHHGLADVVAQLRDARMQWRSLRGRIRCAGEREFPSVEKIRLLVAELSGALFPMRLGPDDLREEHEDAYVELTLAHALEPSGKRTSSRPPCSFSSSSKTVRVSRARLSPPRRIRVLFILSIPVGVGLPDGRRGRARP